MCAVVGDDGRWLIMVVVVVYSDVCVVCAGMCSCACVMVMCVWWVLKCVWLWFGDLGGRGSGGRGGEANLRAGLSSPHSS